MRILNTSTGQRQDQFGEDYPREIGWIKKGTCLLITPRGNSGRVSGWFVRIYCL